MAPVRRTSAVRRRHGRPEKNFYIDYAKRMGFEEVAVEIQDLFLDGK